MKIKFRFPLQYGHSDVEYDMTETPSVGAVIFANNKIIYTVTEIRWEMNVDTKICRPLVVVKDTGEQSDDE